MLKTSKDLPQSGYLPNHNVDPAVIAGGNFAISWTNTYNNNEVFYAKPLVYPPSGASKEVVITVSNQNIVRIVDGSDRSLNCHPSLGSALSSVRYYLQRYPTTIGITGTPLINSATDIMYFFSRDTKEASSNIRLQKYY